jgi:hypothetical protein
MARHRVAMAACESMMMQRRRFCRIAFGVWQVFAEATASTPNE